jgi:hypothetical protein
MKLSSRAPARPMLTVATFSWYNAILLLLKGTKVFLLGVVIVSRRPDEHEPALFWRLGASDPLLKTHRFRAFVIPVTFYPLGRRIINFGGTRVLDLSHSKPSLSKQLLWNNFKITVLA